MREVWTPDEYKAAADGDPARLAALARRRDILIGAAGAAGAAVLGPFVPGTARAAVGGNLNLMVWEGYDLNNELKAWREKNGVSVNLSIISTQDDVQAKLIGGSPVPIDLTEYNQAYNRFYGDELKIIRPIELDKVPNYNEADMLSGFYKGELWHWNDTQYGIPWVWGLVSLIYNPAMMAEPRSYKDLLDPSLTGKIAIVDDLTGTWPMAAILAGYREQFPNLTKEQLADTFEHMKRYRDQTKTFAPSNGDVTSLLVSGDIAACMIAWTGIPVETAKQGVKTAYAIPEEGAIMWCDAWFTPTSAQNPETAHAFINESLRPEVQASIARTAVAGAVNKRAVPLMDPETRALFDYDNWENVFKQAPLLGIPPRESTEHATYDDWVRAYEDLKAGI